MRIREGPRFHSGNHSSLLWQHRKDACSSSGYALNESVKTEKTPKKSNHLVTACPGGGGRPAGSAAAASEPSGGPPRPPGPAAIRYSSCPSGTVLGGDGAGPGHLGHYGDRGTRAAGPAVDSVTRITGSLRFSDVTVTVESPCRPGRPAGHCGLPMPVSTVMCLRLPPPARAAAGGPQAQLGLAGAAGPPVPGPGPWT